MLVSAEAALWAVEHLTPEDFWRDAHVRIFQACQHLVAHKVAVDFLTVSDYFRVHGETEEVGGPVYISQLSDGIPRSTNIEYYAGILQNDRIRRDLIGVADRILAEVVKGEMRGPALIDAADGWLLNMPRPEREDDLTMMRTRVVALKENFDARIAQKGALAGLDTGLSSLNRFTGGLHPGDLTIIAARPGTGKTALAGHMLLTAAQLWKDENVRKTGGFYSLEMSKEQVEYRLVSDFSGFLLTRILNPRGISEYEQQEIRKAIDDLGLLPFAIDATGRITVEEIRSKARRLAAMEGLGLLIVDYIQLITGSFKIGREDRGNRNVELTHASRQLKLLAKELHVPVVVLSQLTRAPENRTDKRPKMSDLRESGALEQDADNIFILHQPPGADDGEGGALIEILIEKQRNGPTGITSVFFQKDVMRFRELTPGERDAMESRIARKERTEAAAAPKKPWQRGAIDTPPRPPGFDFTTDDGE